MNYNNQPNKLNRYHPFKCIALWNLSDVSKMKKQNVNVNVVVGLVNSKRLAKNDAAIIIQVYMKVVLME